MSNQISFKKHSYHFLNYIYLDYLERRHSFVYLLSAFYFT